MQKYTLTQEQEQELMMKGLRSLYWNTKYHKNMVIRESHLPQRTPQQMEEYAKEIEEYDKQLDKIDQLIFKLQE